MQEGAAFVFLGSPDAKGLATPRQLRADGSGAPIQPLGLSGSADRFRVQLTGFPSPRGREVGKLEVEVCPSGVPFYDPSCLLHRSPTWVDLSASPGGILFEETIIGLTEGVLYRWRARMVYAPFSVTEPGISPPPNPRGGPWRRVQAQAVEGNVRMLPEPGVSGLLAGLALAATLARRGRSGSRHGRAITRPGAA